MSQASIPAPGKSVSAAELHEPYRQWCAGQGCRALGMDEFATQFAALCDFAGVKKRSVRGQTRYLDLAMSPKACVDTQLVTQAR